MATRIFVNLPVKDLDRAVTFYTGLGFGKNPQFSGENAVSIIISDTIFVMLLVEPFFSTFTSKPIADASAQTEVILALSADSKDAVDALLTKALEAGAREPRDATDEGFMYTRAFEDPDGHVWEILWMDPSTIEG